jgi:phenylalanyl-tRNA synthetase beta chain
MPNISISRKELEKCIGKKLSDDYLTDRISMMGTPVEKIDRNEVVVEVFPNRPDMLSFQGFARAFATFIGLKKGLSKFDVKKSGEKVIIDKSMKNVRPYTCCAIVKGIRFDDEKIKEIIQIQEKLHITFGRNRKKAAIGIYPYEKIKPPIRFVALKPDEFKFRPLEYPGELTGRQILSMHPTGREYAHLLEGFEKYPVFIDANNRILSMPPIINSHDTGKITHETRDVFIECSGFDFNVLEKCVNMIVTAMADMGGRVCSMELHYPDKKITTPNLNPRKMKLDIGYINKIIGLKLKENEIKNLLMKMGYGFEGKNALIPAYRADIMHQVDLAEDAAIAYGYENFREEIPNVATVGEESKSSKLKNLVAGILVGLGMIETNTYHLINKNIQTKMMNFACEPVEIENSLSKEYDSLRYWLLPSVMEVLGNNKHVEYPQNVFDIGVVFKPDKSQETGVREEAHLAIASCNEKADYTEIRQVLDYLARMLGLNYDVKEFEHKSFIEGRCGKIVINGKDTGFIGEINPQVLENFGLVFPVAALELNLDEVLEL